MSRSCQRATFSSPTSAAPRTTRASPQIRSETIGFRLCGIADEPFWPRAERLLDLAHLRPREVADLEREAFERRRPASASAAQQLRVPVALEDLRRGRRRLEPEPLAGDPLDLRVGRRVRADGAGELADAQSLERALDAGAVAVELERPAGQLQAERRRLGVHAVRAPDRERVAVLLGSRDDRGERACRCPARIRRAGLLDLERERGVEHVRRGQPVVEPAALLAEPLRDGVDERGDVVLRARLDLGDALRRRRRRTARGSPRRRRAGTTPDLRPRVERGELDLEPPRELALAPTRPRPWPGGSSARSPGQTSAAPGRTHETPRMRAASTAAFFALSTPTAATGTPGGICAIASSASRPSSTLRRRAERHADHRQVGVRRDRARAARRRARAADQHAHARARAPSVRTPRPRPGSGAPSARRTRTRSRACRARRSRPASARGRTPSRRGCRPPVRQPTGAPFALRPRCRSGSAAPANAIRSAAAYARVARVADRGAGRRHVEDPAAVRHEPVAVEAPSRRGRRARPSASASSMPVDRRARVARGRVVARREHDGDRGLVGGRERRRPRGRPPRPPRARRGGRPRARGQDRLRLRVAEAAVELEHARPVVGQHQPGEEDADERRAAPRELLEHRPVDRLDELGDLGSTSRARASRSPCRRCSARCRRRRRA